jgi:hypothetical protein
MQFDYCDTLQQGSTPWEFVVQMVMLLYLGESSTNQNANVMVFSKREQKVSLLVLHIQGHTIFSYFTVTQV